MGHAGKRHGMRKRPQKMIRGARGAATMSEPDAKIVRRNFLIYAKKGAPTMARTKRGVTTHARHKKVMQRAKGYRARGHTVYSVAIERLEKGRPYAYRPRRPKQSTLRAHWLQRINAGPR